MHGVDTGRRTLDVDVGVLVGTWEQYARLAEYLCCRYSFTRERDGIQHRYKFQDQLIVDIIPFGALADEQGKIFWPPEADPQMCVLGFEEALHHSILVRVDTDLQIRVVSIPGLALLKLLAWADRRYRQGSDIHDLATILRCCGEIHQERLFEEYVDILEDQNFDLELAGVVLLGREMASIMSKSTHQRITRILLSGAVDVGDIQFGICPLNEQFLLELQLKLPGRQYEKADELVRALLKGFLLGVGPGQAFENT